jgi:hypothetical protein
MRLALTASCSFAVGMAAKLWLILRCGSPLPFWDQWSMFPFLRGDWSLLFAPHNEHRIVFTRLWTLLLLKLNGGAWDCRLEMVGNAAIHCATLSVLGWAVSRRVERSFWPVVWTPLVLIMVLPFGWENTLAGFQSQFYFLLAFSLSAMWLLSTSKPWRARWGAGCACLVASLFTVASGVLAAVAVGGAASVVVWRGTDGRRTATPTVLAAVAVCVCGLLLAVDVSCNHQLRTRSVADFAQSIGSCLAWPWIVVPAFCAVNLSPLAAVAVRWWKEPTPLSTFAVTLGLWVCLQAAAVAFMRGGEGRMPDWRHMDILALIAVVDAVAFAVLFRKEEPC